MSCARSLKVYDPSEGGLSQRPSSPSEIDTSAAAPPTTVQASGAEPEP